MGDLPDDAHVSDSPKYTEVTLTVGFLNEKVCCGYEKNWGVWGVHLNVGERLKKFRVCTLDLSVF